MNFTKKNISVEKSRKLISDLIFKVLSKNLCVGEALILFPKDITDISVQCAWHALVHYEADEDFRNHDTEYSEEQDNYLEMIALILREGKALPQNIIENYNQYYELAMIPRKNNFLSWLKSLLRFTI